MKWVSKRAAWVMTGKKSRTVTPGAASQSGERRQGASRPTDLVVMARASQTSLSISRSAPVFLTAALACLALLREGLWDLQHYPRSMLSERLRRLDNRVLRVDERRAALRTEAGWRQQAARWRRQAVCSALLLGIPSIASVFGFNSLFTLIPLGGVFAFHAGMLKAEDDRLNERGPLERMRPPGL